MKPLFKKSFIYIFLGAISLLNLSGCQSTSKSTEPPIQTNTLQGRVVDGPVSGSSCCIDLNVNNSCDSDEPTSQSNNQGFFEINLENLSSNDISNKTIICNGGTDIDTNQVLDIPLKSTIPASHQSTNRIQTTPITTLLSEATNQTQKENILKNIGIPADVDPDELLITDYYASNTELARKIVEKQTQVMNLTKAMKRTLTTDNSQSSRELSDLIYKSFALEAMNPTLISSSATEPFSSNILQDSSTIKKVLNNASSSHNIANPDNQIVLADSIVSAISKQIQDINSEYDNPNLTDEQKVRLSESAQSTFLSSIDDLKESQDITGFNASAINIVNEADTPIQQENRVLEQSVYTAIEYNNLSTAETLLNTWLSNDPNSPTANLLFATVKLNKFIRDYNTNENLKGIFDLISLSDAPSTQLNQIYPGTIDLATVLNTLDTFLETISTGQLNAFVSLSQDYIDDVLTQLEDIESSLLKFSIANQSVFLPPSITGEASDIEIKPIYAHALLSATHLAKVPLLFANTFSFEITDPLNSDSDINNPSITYIFSKNPHFLTIRNGYSWSAILDNIKQAVSQIETVEQLIANAVGDELGFTCNDFWNDLLGDDAYSTCQENHDQFVTELNKLKSALNGQYQFDNTTIDIPAFFSSPVNVINITNFIHGLTTFDPYTINYVQNKNYQTHCDRSHVFESLDYSKSHYYDYPIDYTLNGLFPNQTRTDLFELIYHNITDNYEYDTWTFWDYYLQEWVTYNDGCYHYPHPGASETASKPTCDSTLVCEQAETCVNGLLYPTTCGSSNCDFPINTCETPVSIETCDPQRICTQALTCENGFLYPTGCASSNCDSPINTCETNTSTSDIFPEFVQGNWIAIADDGKSILSVSPTSLNIIDPDENDLIQSQDLHQFIRNDFGEDAFNSIQYLHFVNADNKQIFQVTFDYQNQSILLIELIQSSDSTLTGKAASFSSTETDSLTVEYSTASLSKLNADTDHACISDFILTQSLTSCIQDFFENSTVESLPPTTTSPAGSTGTNNVSDSVSSSAGPTDTIVQYIPISNKSLYGNVSSSPIDESDTRDFYAKKFFNFSSPNEDGSVILDVYTFLNAHTPTNGPSQSNIFQNMEKYIIYNPETSQCGDNYNVECGVYHYLGYSLSNRYLILPLPFKLNTQHAESILFETDEFSGSLVINSMPLNDNRIKIEYKADETTVLRYIYENSTLLTKENFTLITTKDHQTLADFQQEYNIVDEDLRDLENQFYLNTPAGSNETNNVSDSVSSSVDSTETNNTSDLFSLTTFPSISNDNSAYTPLDQANTVSTLSETETRLLRKFNQLNINLVTKDK